MLRLRNLARDRDLRHARRMDESQPSRNHEADGDAPHDRDDWAVPPPEPPKPSPGFLWLAWSSLPVVMTSDIDDGSTPAYNPVTLWIVENLMGAESPNEVPGINVGIALAVVALVWWVIAIGEWVMKPGERRPGEERAR